MKKTKELQELRDKGTSDLLKELLTAQKKLTELSFSRAFLKIKNYHEITSSRKKIARIWTILQEKSLAEIEKTSIKEKSLVKTENIEEQENAKK